MFAKSSVQPLASTTADRSAAPCVVVTLTPFLPHVLGRTIVNQGFLGRRVVFWIIVVEVVSDLLRFTPCILVQNTLFFEHA